MRIPLLAGLVFIALTLIACSTAPYKEAPESPDYVGKLAARNDIREKLMAQHHEWQAVPYQYGGLNKRGVDCSGFVYLTYRNKFGIKLPRSTEQQSKTGRQVSQARLKVGDMVFFKTGIAQQHVGIYLGKRRFLHASTSIGVTISNMDNVYWRSKYWKAQRI